MKMTATEHAGMPSVPNAPLYYIVQEGLGLCIVQLVRTSFALVASLSLVSTQRIFIGKLGRVQWEEPVMIMPPDQKKKWIQFGGFLLNLNKSDGIRMS